MGNIKKEQVIQQALDNRAMIWGYLMGLTKDPNQAEDLFQNTYLVICEKWDQYEEAYELMLHSCSTAWAPWHVIPADRKWARNAAVAAIARATLEAMNPQYPKPDWNPKDFKVD